MKTLYENGWHFAVRAARNGVPGFIAWAKREPIEADSPLREPFIHEIYYRFGPTEEDALDYLRSEVFGHKA